jgi:hypothetical protein
MNADERKMLIGVYLRLSAAQGRFAMTFGAKVPRGAKTFGCVA